MTRLSQVRFINVDRTRMPVRERIRPRGVPNALQDYEIAVTTDVAQATEVTTQLLGRTHLSTSDPGGFGCQLNAIQLLDVTMAYLDYGVATDLDIHSPSDCYSVHMTTSGHARVHIGGHDHDLSPFFAMVISPNMSYRIHLDPASPQLIVRIGREAMERGLSRILGRSVNEPLVFEPVSDLTTDAASRWTGALNILSAEVMAKGSLIHAGVAAGPLEELIVSTLLYIQPSNFSDQLRTVERRSGRAAVRRSIDYIEQHLAEPITLTDLAQHARMSVRSIQAGFRQDLATTPVAYIRERRLVKAREMLLSALPGDGITVTDAAHSWGFSHLGNFSVTYRQRFGESPSQTLRGSANA